ncbi:MAG: CBS domain-containing protein [Victivallaceae bacterium]|nr:CBS domain-containing protein [Victivallaceae bacterium]
MKMKRVLAEKIRRKHKPIYVIAFDATVKEAAKMMYAEKIGAILVNMPAKEDGVYAGIVSERDIITSCANYSNFETLPVSKIMSRNLICTDLEDNVNSVVRCMRQHHIRHIPLTENGKIIALLSIRDLMYCLDIQNEMTMSHMSDMLGACRRNANY